MATAASFPWLVAGRLLGGVAGAGYSPNIQVALNPARSIYTQLPAPHQIFVAEIAEAEHRGLLLGLTVPVMAVGVLAVYGLGGWGVETPL